MIKLKVMFSGFVKYQDLLYELVVRDIKIRYRRSFLGLLWTLLNPILMMAVITLVFSHLFRFDIENFAIYFFTGNILFAFVAESTTNALYSITGSGNLIKKVYIPKYLFPMSKVLSSVVNLFFSYIAMMLVMVFTGVSFHVTMILSIIVMAYIIMFALGLGLILATVMVFFRDTAHLYGVVTLAWMYLTPIFYPISMLQGKLDIVLKINPMVYFITYLRNVVLYNMVPSMGENLTCFGIGVGFLIVGLFVFYRNQDKFILYI
ncbi:ABC transporter permease [Desulfosporosinus sp. Sb-LF]|uniref:ABC transporter permease n=1 Tax=Desulfosporosinus sp. Sb-LF TaxID=2560027 RepID=UPI00107F7C81|nr:ABC transporter permease [Desulfosporosinus sp. Sb-LF]TGE33797.1 ABC transporter permease [Desulfosporosinus sp. Sb-LF]